MNANELKVLEDSLKVIEQLQAEKEALEQRVDEVKDTNGTLVDLVQLQREEIDKLRQQQAEIEALKMGFANSGTHDSELAETRAMAGRLFLKVQDLEFEQEGYENLTEMLESEKAELTEKNCQQQAEIEALKKQLAIILEANTRSRP